VTAIRQCEVFVSAVNRQGGHFEWKQHFSAEAFGLPQRATRQLAAADTVSEHLAGLSTCRS